MRNPRTRGATGRGHILAIALVAGGAFGCRGPATRSASGPPPPSEPADPTGDGAVPGDATAPPLPGTPIDVPAKSGAMAAVWAQGEGPPQLAWLEPRAEGGHRVRISALADGRFTAPVTVATTSRVLASPDDTPKLLQGGDGELLVSFPQGPLAAPGEHPAGYEVALAARQANGAPFIQLDTPHRDRSDAEHGFASLLATDRGAQVFWLDGRAVNSGGATQLMVAELVGGTVGPEVVLDDRVCDCCPTDAAMTVRGPVVVYRDRSGDEIRDIAIVRQVGGTWRAPESVHRDGWKVTGCPVNGPAVAARGATVAVAWHTEADGFPAVKVAFSRDAGAHFDRPITVADDDTDGYHLGRVDLVLEPTGAAVVSWVTVRDDASYAVVRRVTPAGQVGDDLVVAGVPTDRRSGIPRLKLWDRDLLIAWTADQRPTRVRVQTLPVARIPAAIAGAGAGKAKAPTGATKRGVTVGSQAPPYGAQSTGGAPTSLADLGGRVIVLNLWATWCAPCKVEMPHFATLHTRYRSRGLEVVAVSVDAAEARARVLAYVQSSAFPFTVWLDPEDRASGLFAVTALPVTLVIDRHGRIVFRHDGAVTADHPELIAAIEAAL